MTNTVTSRDKAAHKVAVLQKAEKEAKIRLARINCDAFIEYCFTDQETGEPCIQTWFHKEWQAAMEEHNNVYIVAPRGHGKTSQIVGRVIFQLGKRPETRVKIVCQTEGKAKDRIYEIRQAIELNQKVREVFPNLIPAEKQQWTQFVLIIKRRQGIRDPSVEVCSILGSVSGGRADLLIFDDVCDRKNSLDQPKLRKVVKRAYFSDYLPTLEPSGKKVYICTLWHRDDLNSKLRNSKVYHIIDNSIDSKTIEPIWPEKWTRERLLVARAEMPEDEFLRAYCNVLKSDSLSIVKYDWIRYYDILPPRNDLFIFQVVDPASELSEGSDYFGHGTFAFDHKNMVLYILDIFNIRIPFPQQLVMIYRLFHAAKADVLLVENVAYQRVLAQFLSLEGIESEAVLQMVAAVLGLNYTPEPLPIIEVYPISNKTQRLRVASVYFKQKRVLWNKILDPNSDIGRPARMPRLGSPVSQITEYPNSVNDDMVDVATYGTIWCFQECAPFGLYGNNEQAMIADLNIRTIGTR
jgi:hypothetical protein